jgi:hypothetical protein
MVDYPWEPGPKGAGLSFEGCGHEDPVGEGKISQETERSRKVDLGHHTESMTHARHWQW